MDFLTSELRSARRNPDVGDPACGSLHIKKGQTEIPASRPDALEPVTQGVSVLQPILAAGVSQQGRSCSFTHLSVSLPCGFQRAELQPEFSMDWGAVFVSLGCWDSDYSWNIREIVTNVGN